MTIEDDIAFLERIPILRRLGAAGLRILAIGAESYALEAGQVLFNAGEPADGAYVIQRGAIILKPDKPGERGVIAGPGTLLGEIALLTPVKRPATAIARDSSTVLRLSRSMFLRMLDGYPDAAQRIREMLAARSDQWTRDLQNIRAALQRAAAAPD